MSGTSQNVNRRVAYEQVYPSPIHRHALSKKPGGQTLLLRAPTALDVLPPTALSSLALQTLTDRINQIKESAHAMRACEWANSRERLDLGIAQIYEQKKIAQELAQENKELLIKRKRMKEFLAAEALTFEMQLNAQGKAFNVSEA